MRVSAIVPAAGASSRMGGPHKLLLPYKGLFVVRHVINALSLASLEAVILVTGRDADLVREAAGPGVTACVHNEQASLGLGSSIALGVRATAGGSAILIALADMPNLRVDVVTALMEAATPDTIVAPAYADEPSRFGHPILFGTDFRAQLMELSGDAGARAIIEAHRDCLRVIPVQGRLDDIDEPADLD